MSEANGRSDLHRFKEFINKHPKLRASIRKNGKSWQEIYEQWTLLGEEDEYWSSFKEDAQKEEKEEAKQGSGFSKLDLKPDLIKQVLKYTESIDVNKLQEQVQQLSKTLSTVQEIVNQYQTPDQEQKGRDQPFHWFRD